MSISSSDSANKLGNMPISRLIIEISIPLIISMLVQAGYNLADSIFVAGLNENALTAVSLAFPIQTVLIGLAVGTSVGIGSLVSRRFGEHDDNGAARAAQTGVVLALLSWVLLAGIIFIMTNTFVIGQTKDLQIIKYSKDYIYIVGIGSVGVFMQIIFERMLQSTGKSMLSMITQISGVIVNVILDPILIYGMFGFPRLEVAGAAIATVMGQLIGMLIGLMLNLIKNKEINFRLPDFTLELKTVNEIYKIAIPSIFMQIVGSIMIFFYNRILIAITPTAVAVFGAYFKLNGFIFMPVFAMNSALTTIISYNFGAKNPNRIREAMKKGTIIAVSIMLMGTILFQIAPKLLLMMFKPSEDFLAIGIPALRTMAIIFPFAGLSIVVTSLFQSVGRAYYSLIVSLIRQIIIIVPTGYILSHYFKLKGVWWAFPLAEIGALVMVTIFYKEIDRNILKKLGETDKLL